MRGMAAAIPYVRKNIGQVQFPDAGAVLACLGEACQTALCVDPAWPRDPSTQHLRPGQVSTPARVSPNPQSILL